MALTINPARCPQNHRCPLIQVCSVQAISQIQNGLPEIDDSKCTECGKCTRFCPTQAIIKKI